MPRLVTDSHSPIAWHLDCYQLWPMLASVRATVNGINALHPGHQVAPSLAITITLPRHGIISYSASASTQATRHLLLPYSTEADTINHTIVCEVVVQGSWPTKLLLHAQADIRRRLSEQ